MKKNIYQSLLLAASISMFAACKPTLDTPEATKGSMDPTRYVAIGNSITSGFADAALYRDGQEVSYANILAGQFKLVGGGDFKQPLVSAGSVGIGSSLNAKLILGYATDCKGVRSLSPIPAAATGDYTIFASNIYGTDGPFNNMGVPGAKAITTVYPGYGNPANGVGNYNPFFARMASNPATASILADAAAQNPTFFSVFIGNNDVLAYALAGGASDAITPSAGSPGVGFDASIDLIISTMSANGAKGVIGNIPDITSLPYFTTVPYNGLTLDAATATYLTSVYAANGLPYTFHAGANAFIIADPSVPGGLRPMNDGELVLLSTPQDSLKCAMWGSSPLKPIPNQYILTAAEISSIETAVGNYNSKLRSAASAKGYAFVDVNAFMRGAKTGITYNGVAASTTFVTGGAFSLDGIHLTPFGNALLANEFIKSINATYGATIPQVDANKYHGIIFP
ncbi:MAG: hypothetical protein JWP12_3016 [Bacteroidetes bacterium]|nr:hypothetical protein [Bacteroidota bacterium]